MYIYIYICIYIYTHTFFYNFIAKSCSTFTLRGAQNAR